MPASGPATVRESCPSNQLSGIFVRLFQLVEPAHPLNRFDAKDNQRARAQSPPTESFLWRLLQLKYFELQLKYFDHGTQPGRNGAVQN